MFLRSATERQIFNSRKADEVFTEHGVARPLDAYVQLLEALR